MKKKHGFTLAEVLITLAIIGVVAAITLPTLMQDGRKQQLGTKLAKFQNQLEKVTRAAAIEGDLIDLDNPSNIDELDKLLVDELLFSENNVDSIIKSNITTGDIHGVALRDGTEISIMPQTDGHGHGRGSTSIALLQTYGPAVAIVGFNPAISGLEGQKNFLFVITTKGFVLPDDFDECNLALFKAKWKATKAYNKANKCVSN